MKYILPPSDEKFAWNVSTNAINLMTEYKVLPTPQNYHVWYSYSAESDFQLTSFIEKIMAKGFEFDEDLNNKVFEKFFAPDKETKAVNETGAMFQKELAKLANALKASGQSTTNHTASLSEQIEKLSDFEGVNDLKDIIQLVISDTDKIKQEAENLEKELDESSSIIQNLQNNLDNARIESRTDALTNIGNRKYFDEKIKEFMNDYTSKGQDLCLILSDIDFFKKFNDTYGHQIGDQVLKVVAHVLKQGSELIGFPARYGGEEFAILVPNTKLGDGIKLAEEIRNTISMNTIKNKANGTNFGKITMSFGVANASKNGSIEEIVKNADAALYLSKQNGRNRVQSEKDLDSVVSDQSSAVTQAL